MAGVVCTWAWADSIPLPSKMLWLGRQMPLPLSLSHGYRQARPRSQHSPR